MNTVTAIITTHKRPPEIVGRALDSVLRQTYPDIEVIVVDDSPADFAQREDVCNLVKSKGIQYIPHSSCKGACAARNTGLFAAHGEFVAFLDDDDEWFPEKIEKQLKRFSPSTGLVYCASVRCFDDTGEECIREATYRRGMVYPELVMENFIGSTSIPLIRKATIEEIGGFDILMESAQDADVWLRLAARCEVDYVDEPLVRYHIHSGERITTNPKKKISGLERINLKNSDYLKKNRAARWKRTIDIVPFYAADMQFMRALLVWLKAVSCCPWKIETNIRYLWKGLRAATKRIMS